MGPRIDGPDADGFSGVTFDGPGFSTTFGRVLVRAEGDAVARIRTGTGLDRVNEVGGVHGGFLLAFLDQALFVGTVALKRVEIGKAVTLNLSTQFVGAGRIGQPLDCLVEVVSETGRLVFLRGLMEQGEHKVLTFQATIRKFVGEGGRP